MDLFIGYGCSINKDVDFDVGYLAYLYVADGSDSSASEFGELYAGLTFMENTSLHIALADDDTALCGSASTVKLSHTVPLENDFGLNLAYAYWDFYNPGFDLSTYLIDVTREYNGFTFDLSYIDTDIDNDPNADVRVVFSVGMSF